MRDVRKTKAQLIHELDAARQRISELEAIGSSNSSKASVDGEEGAPDTFHDLLEGDRRVQTLFGAIRAGILIQSAEGKILYSNKVAQEVFDLPAATIASRTSEHPDWEMILEDGTSVAGMDHPSMVTLRTGVPMRDEVRGLFAGDVEKMCWLLINTEPVFEEGAATPAEVISTFIDITRLKQAEAALEASEARYRTIFEVAEDAIFVADPDTGMMLDCNPRGEALVGRSREELKTMHQTELHPPQQLGYYRDEFAQSTVNRGAKFTEVEVLHKDGHLTPVEISSGGIVDLGESRVHFGIFRDISARKRAEVASREQHALFRAIAENYPNSFISIVESDYTVGFTSGQEFKKQGLDPRQFIGCSLEEVFGEQAPAVRQHYEATFAGEQRTFELFVNEQDQLYKTVPLRGGDGTIPRILVVVENITDRVNAERQLRESVERARSYVENAPCGVFIVDERGRYLEVNSVAAAITGYSTEELIQLSIPDLLPPEGHEFGARHFQTLLAQGKASGEGPLLTKSGERRVWSIDAVKLSETRFLGFVADVTERERQQQQLLEEKERAQRYLDIAAVMLLGLDTEGKITLINRRGCEILGVEHQDALLGQDWFRHIPQERREEVRSVHRANMAGLMGEKQRVEGPLLTVSGEQRWMVWHNAVVRDPQGNIVGSLSSGEDATARRTLEAQLAQSDRLTSMGMLAAGVAHEINNPLAYLLYNIESLAEDLPVLLGALRLYQTKINDQLGPGAAEELARAASQRVNLVEQGEFAARFKDALEGAHRIRDVARGLGTFSRVEDDQLVPVDLSQVIEVAVNMAQNEIKYRARLVKEYGKVPTVLASEGRLSQVFLNLLINATHAIDEGDLEHNEIRVRTWAEGDHICAEVSDTGSGISPENMTRLFDPFFTTKQIGEGAGLGLTISKNIIESYDGTLSVQSVPGQGTCFTLRMPVQGADQPRPQLQAEHEAEQVVRGCVLVVDDEEGIRKIMARLLSPHEVVQAASGAAAKEILVRDQAFDLILCDVMMPDVSGIELHQWLVAEHASLAQKVIFVSGGAFTPNAREYLQRVNIPRLEKPFERATFKKIVNEHMQQSRAAKK